MVESASRKRVVEREDGMWLQLKIKILGQNVRGFLVIVYSPHGE